MLVLLGVLPAAAQNRQRTTRPPHTGAEQQQQLEDDKAAIQKLHEKDIQASLALDIPTLESLWTDEIVTMPPGEPAVIGKQANEKRLEDSAAALKSTEIMAYDEQWQEIRIQGDWAYEWGTISGRTRPFSGGNETSYKYNAMRILNRQPDGTWKIARSIYNDANPATAAEPEKKAEPKRDPLKD
ncbi:MAG: YybH family protein [Terriglobales bacterium]